jgi:hypothetical protein
MPWRGSEAAIGVPRSTGVVVRRGGEVGGGVALATGAARGVAVAVGGASVGRGVRRLAGFNDTGVGVGCGGATGAQAALRIRTSRRTERRIDAGWQHIIACGYTGPRAGS